MVNFRRNRIRGGIYFFTLTLKNRKSNLLTKHITLLGQVMRSVKEKHPYKIHAIVILPDHLHMVMELPKNDDNYSLRWQQIKSLFTKYIIQKGEKLIKNKRGEYNLWQRRFWEHTIRDETDYKRHVDYIHYNPVKHRLVANVADWPYSSFARYVKEGLLPNDWCFWGEDMDRE